MIQGKNTLLSAKLFVHLTRRVLCVPSNGRNRQHNLQKVQQDGAHTLKIHYMHKSKKKVTSHHSVTLYDCSGFPTKIYEAAGTADSTGDSCCFCSDSQSTSFRILNLSSRLTKPDWGATAPEVPALCTRITVLSMAGPWSFPVNSTRSGINSDFPCSQVNTAIQCVLVVSFSCIWPGKALVFTELNEELGISQDCQGLYWTNYLLAVLSTSLSSYHGLGER